MINTLRRVMNIGQSFDDADEFERVSVGNFTDSDEFIEEVKLPEEVK